MEAKLKRIADKEREIDEMLGELEALSEKIIGEYRQRAHQEIHRLTSDAEASFDHAYADAKTRAYADRRQEIEHIDILKTVFLKDYEKNLEGAVNQVIEEVLNYGNR